MIYKACNWVQADAIFSQAWTIKIQDVFEAIQIFLMDDYDRAWFVLINSSFVMLKIVHCRVNVCDEGAEDLDSSRRRCAYLQTIPRPSSWIMHACVAAPSLVGLRMRLY